MSDDDIEAIRIHVRQGSESGEVTCCTEQDLENDADFLQDQWNNCGFSGRFREFVIEARARRPSHMAPTLAAITVPDEALPDPVTAHAVA